MIRRSVGFLLDWYVGSVLTALPITTMYHLLMPDEVPVMDLRKFPFAYAALGAAAALAVSVLYYIVVPYLTNGQTLGKKVAGIRMVEEGRNRISLRALLMRQFIGIILVEGSLYAVTPLLWQVLCYSAASLQQKVTWVYYGLTLLSVAMLLFGNGRALHDYLARTSVRAAYSGKEHI